MITVFKQIRGIFFSTILVWILLFGTVSCLNFHVASQESFEQIAPAKRAKDTAAIKSWDINGVLSVKTEQDSFIGSYKWQQQLKRYQIRLSVPLNLVTLDLFGAIGGHVTLQRSNGEIYEGTSPEALLYQQAGFSLPISDLFYWIRGIPAPTPGHELTDYDSFGHLIGLKQHGFSVTFSKYRTIDGVDLPQQLDLSQDSQLQIRIVVKNWSINR